MSGKLKYVELEHDCQKPSTDHLPRYGSRRQVIAKWRCPECRSKWEYRAIFLDDDRFGWRRYSSASRRWRKGEAQRLALLAVSDV